MFDRLYSMISKLKSKEESITLITFTDINGASSPLRPNYRDYKSSFALTRFNGGELYAKIPTGLENIVKITVWATYPCEEFSLALVFDALGRAYPTALLELNIDYLPHGRQDRVCKEGESFSSHVFFGLMQSANVTKITTLDLHSQKLREIAYPIELVDSLEAELSKFVNSYVITEVEAILCPDKGAEARCTLLGKLLNVPVLYCQKERAEDITVTVPKEINKYKNIVVFDDICDAGGTFLELKKHIPDNIQTTLLVSHGIFANDARVKLYDAGYSQVYALRYQ